MTRRSRLISVFDRHARRRDEHGYVLALTALIILPLLLISAMAVDYGGWYSQGARMQRAADAAALAGVVWLPDLATATTVAQSTAKANGYDDDLYLQSFSPRRPKSMWSASNRERVARLLAEDRMAPAGLAAVAGKHDLPSIRGPEGINVVTI